ncbi:MAG: hypothetical protein GTO02_19025, partial [Candidatus Dadabacteria bacterium]|nr:hypothetical protein [Candidatus Dadabacteria bacterium]
MTLQQRWKEHIRHWNCGDNISIYKYFDKYGIDQFKISILKKYKICDKKHVKAYEQLQINRIDCVNDINAFSCGIHSHPIIRAEQKRQYYEQNKDHILERTKRYYERNKEKVAEQQKLYREQNKEKRVEYDKHYYEANKDHILERTRQYREQNKKKITERKKQK